MTLPGTCETVAASVEALPPVDLEALILHAALQARVDRKYIVPPEVLAKLLAELAGDLQVLEIDDNRQFRYQSVYFDTEDYRCFRSHVQGKRRRFKVRTRCYLDSGDCSLEIKMEGRRAETVKSRLPYDPDDSFALTGEGLRFIADIIAEPDTGRLLRPVILSQYKRTTLVDMEAQTRMTCDVDLEWVSERRESGDPMPSVLIETKTQGPESAADKLLRAYGHRPVKISKYCLGVALLNPELPANPWHRTLRRNFGWTALDELPTAS